MKKVIGYAGVDSGQILICDPGYIDSDWKKEEFTDIRRFEIPERELFVEYPRDFKNYEELIPMLGKTMNQLLESGEAVELKNNEASKHPFSYNACCKKTLDHNDDGQLCFESGFNGVGVVSRTGWGDGFYPVVADIDKETQRVKSVTILFIYDEHEEEEWEQDNEEE